MNTDKVLKKLMPKKKITVDLSSRNLYTATTSSGAKVSTTSSTARYATSSGWQSFSSGSGGSGTSTSSSSGGGGGGGSGGSSSSKVVAITPKDGPQAGQTTYYVGGQKVATSTTPTTTTTTTTPTTTAVSSGSKSSLPTGVTVSPTGKIIIDTSKGPVDLRSYQYQVYAAEKAVAGGYATPQQQTIAKEGIKAFDTTQTTTAAPAALSGEITPDGRTVYRGTQGEIIATKLASGKVVDRTGTEIAPAKLAEQVYSVSTLLQAAGKEEKQKVLEPTKTPEKQQPTTFTPTGNAVFDFFKSGGTTYLPGVAPDTRQSVDTELSGIEKLQSLAGFDTRQSVDTELAAKYEAIAKIKAAGGVPVTDIWKTVDVTKYTIPATIPKEFVKELEISTKPKEPEKTITLKESLTQTYEGAIDKLTGIQEKGKELLSPFYGKPERDEEIKQIEQQLLKQQKEGSKKYVESKERQNIVAEKIIEKQKEAKQTQDILNIGAKELEKQKGELQAKQTDLQSRIDVAVKKGLTEDDYNSFVKEIQKLDSEFARYSKSVQNYNLVSEGFGKAVEQTLGPDSGLMRAYDIWGKKAEAGKEQLLYSQEQADKKIAEIQGKDYIYNLSRKASRDWNYGIEDIKAGNITEGSWELFKGLSQGTATGTLKVLRGTSDVAIGKPIRTLQTEGVPESFTTKFLKEKAPVAEFILRPQLKGSEFVGKYLEGVGRGVYDWKEPLKTDVVVDSTNIIPDSIEKWFGERQYRIKEEGVLGAINLATFGIGAVGGATSGETLPAIPTTTSKVVSGVSTGLKWGVGITGTGLVLGVPAYEQVQYDKAITKIKDELSNLETQKSSLTEKDYQLTKKYYENQLKKLEENRPGYGARVGESLGEIGTIMAGGVAGSYFGQRIVGPPVQNVKFQQFTQEAKIERLQGGTGRYKPRYTPEGQAKFEKSVGGKLGEGFRVAPGKEPFVTPSKTTSVFTYQERPAGFGGLFGKRIQTEMQINTAGQITRTRLFDGMKYVTTQSPRSTEAITKIFSAQGRLLGTVKEPLINTGQLLAITSSYQDLSKPVRISPEELATGTATRPAKLTGKQTATEKLEINKLINRMQVTGKADRVTTRLQTTEIGPQERLTFQTKGGPGGERIIPGTEVSQNIPYRLTYDLTKAKITPGKKIVIPKEFQPAAGQTVSETQIIGGKVTSLGGYDVPFGYTRAYQLKITPPAQTTSQTSSLLIGEFNVAYPSFAQEASLAAKDVSSAVANTLKTIGKAGQFAIKAPAYASAGMLAVPRTEFATTTKGVTNVVGGVSYPSSIFTTGGSLFGPIPGVGAAIVGGVSYGALAGGVAGSLLGTTSPMVKSVPLIATAPLERTITSGLSALSPALVQSVSLSTDVITKPAPIEPTIPGTETTNIYNYITPTVLGLTGLASLGGWKMPTFGGLGGMGGWGGGGGYSTRRRTRSWLVVNPIRRFDEEWLARQKVKTISQLTGTGTTFLKEKTSKPITNEMLRSKI